MVEPHCNSLRPDNQGEIPPNGLLSRGEVAFSYETMVFGVKHMVIKCSVCHHTLDVAYAKGSGFAGMDLILIEPHKCPGKVLPIEQAMAWDQKHRKIKRDPKWRIQEK